MFLLRKVVMIILWLVIVPFLTGIVPGFLFEKNKKRLGTVYLSGWVFMTAIFQLLAVPIIMKRSAFVELENLYGILMTIISIFSILFLIVKTGTNSLNDYFELPNYKKIKKSDRGLWLFFTAMMFFQMLMSILLMTSDGDDAYYVTQAVIATQKDRMYTESPYVGVIDTLQYRHVLAPFPMLIAFFARKFDLHAAIVAHTVLPPVLIGLTYLIYYKICQALIPEDNSKQPLFMLLLSGLQLFGATSVYTNEMFFLTRTWQGKSVLANIVIPMAFYLMLQLCRQTEKGENHRYRSIGIFVLLLLTNMMGALMSSLGLLLLFIFESIMTILIAVRNKLPQVLIGTALAMIPCYVYMIIYVVMK